MPLFVTKHERFPSADRNELALAYTRAVGESEGVSRMRRAAVAPFARADLATNTVNEVWDDAKAGPETFELAQRRRSADAAQVLASRPIFDKLST